MPEMLNRRSFLAVAGLAALAGSSSNTPTTAAAAVSQSDIDKAMATPSELTFWTWVPDIDQEIALFQRKYPADLLADRVAAAGSRPRPP